MEQRFHVPIVLAAIGCIFLFIAWVMGYSGDTTYPYYLGVTMTFYLAGGFCLVEDKNRLIYVLAVIGGCIGIAAGAMGINGEATWELVLILAGVPFALAAFFLIDRRDAEETGEKIDKFE